MLGVLLSFIAAYELNHYLNPTDDIPSIASLRHSLTN